MGLLKSLGLKKETSKGPATQSVPPSSGAKSSTGTSHNLWKPYASNPGTPLSRGLSSIQRSVSNFAAAIPPLQPRGFVKGVSIGSGISRRSVPASGPLAPTEYMRTTPEGQAVESKSDGESEDTNELRRSTGATEEKENVEEDESPKPPAQLGERVLRRDDVLAPQGPRAEIVDRIKGGSLRYPPSRYTKDLAGEVVTEPAAATVADRPCARNRRRNPSLETILRNMYGDGAGPRSSTSSAPKPQSTGPSRSGQLQQRPPPEPEPVTKARSGVLPPRDREGGPEPEEAKGVGVGVRVLESARAPKSGQLAPRDFGEEQKDRGSSARARMGQVAPDQATMKIPGGSGQLAARDWNPPAPEAEEAKVEAYGRSRSGQFQAVTPGAAAERFKAGPRSMITQRPAKDSLSGERQQKGAAQRRFSRNRGPSGNEGGDAPQASSWRDRTPGVGAGAWVSQAAIAEETENGSGSVKARNGPHPAMPALSGLSSSHRPGMRAPASFSAYSTPSSSTPAPGGQSDKPPATPITASQRLAASLAASVASVNAQKGGKGTRSGLLQPVHNMVFGRKQEGVGDNVLNRPFANVREKYQLQMEELGRGRFGVIRMCVDRKSGEKLACKSISKARLKSWQDTDDVRKEVTVMELLQGHPHVVNLKGAFEDALNVHLVMELCEGGELFDRIMAKKKYSEPEAAIVCRTVVGVLRYLHALGYIHRDLKPENILLCSKDNDTSVKVIDFGVATPFKAGVPCMEEVGTPFYLAPEVLRNCYGAEADIWSAGVVLYILLCGVPPFWAKDTEGIRAAIQEGNLDLASGPWKSISDSAKDLVRNMLVMNPSDRIKGDAILGELWSVLVVRRDFIIWGRRF